MMNQSKIFLFQCIIGFLLIWLVLYVVLFNRTVDQCSERYQMVQRISTDQKVTSRHQDRYAQKAPDAIKAYLDKHRHISNNIEEFWFYVQSELTKLKMSQTGDSEALDKVLDMSSQFKRSLLMNMDELRSMEGSDKTAAKQNTRLANLVQARLRYIQNPPDCAKARKVSCNIEWPCGFGCQLHHVTYCLIIAYATNRTLVLNSEGWRYHSGGWDAVFEPLSQNCRTLSGSDSVSYWPDYDSDKQIIKLSSQTYSFGPSQGPGFIPRRVPQDIAQYLNHGEPIVWWVGQIISYIFRPNAQLLLLLASHARKIDFSLPVVGVHIRRSDKIGTEAEAHSIDEYMRHVVEYYDQVSLRTPNITRRVYVATDEVRVIAEIRAKYPTYTILGDAAIATSAGVGKRYSEAGLMGVVTDLWFLAHSDYLVCTFSSQICRIAYELLNSAVPGDASLNYKSLDDIWFFAGQLDNLQLALEDHKPQDSRQIELRRGDQVRPAGNHWDGFSLGTNVRTGAHGLYPSFKVRSWVETFPFPRYPEVTLPSR